MNSLEVKELCEVTGVSRSGYYNWLRRRDNRKQREFQDKKDYELILKAYKFRGYDKGARGIYMRLLHMGIRMNVKKIRRLMKKLWSDVSNKNSKSIQTACKSVKD